MKEISHDWERKISISTKGLAVTWKNLTVVANEKRSHLFKKNERRQKTILNGVSGAIQPETLVAILGASGSGKSTLMSVLANRNSTDLEVDGIVTIGGKPRGDFTRYVSGFVYQDDLFIPSLTVTEHLNFIAKLRLRRNINEKTRMTLIDDILNLLGLVKVANSRIGRSSFGNEKINLSGGEKKRLSIATELITDPRLLFCDEPTTGLDSFTALNVITHLKSLAILRQKTIVCSIHQPNAQIFGLFHQVILLCKGRVAFSGPSYEAVEFFQKQGFTVNNEENSADYLIRNLALTASSEMDLNKLCGAYEISKYSKIAKEQIDKEMSAEVYNDSKIFYNNLNEVLWVNKLWYLTQRNWLSINRDLSAQGLRLAQKLLIGLLLGLCLRGTVTWTQTGLLSLKGAVILMISQNFFPAVHLILNFLPEKLPLFYREYSNNINTPLIFYLSNLFGLLPGFILDPVLFTLLVCWLTDLTSSLYAIIVSCLITTLVLNTSAAFGTFMSLIFESYSTASSVITPVEIMCIICSGVYIKLSTLPWFLQWIPYISWFTYASEAMFILHVDEVENIACDPNPTVPCIKTGEEFLANFDFSAVHLWPNVLGICLLYFVLHLTGYMALMRKLTNRKA